MLTIWETRKLFEYCCLSIHEMTPSLCLPSIFQSCLRKTLPNVILKNSFFSNMHQVQMMSCLFSADFYPNTQLCLPSKLLASSGLYLT